MKPLFAFPLLLTLLTTSLFAQNDSRRIVEQIAPMINDNVALVIHVDTQRFEPGKFGQSVENLLPEEGTREFVKAQIIETKTNMESFVNEFRDRNIRDVYLLSIPALWPNHPLITVIPLPENLSEKDRTDFNASNGQLAIGNFGVFYGNDPLEPTAKKILEQASSPRPELLDAFQSLGNAEVKIAVIPPTYFKRLLTESEMKLPKPLASVSIPVLLEGVQWAAIGLEGEKKSVELKIRSQNSQAAKDLRAEMEKWIDESLSANSENAASVLRLVTAFPSAKFETVKDVKHLLVSLLPKPNAAEDAPGLSLKIDEDFAREKCNTLLPLAAFLVRMGLQDGNSKQCTKNLMEITLALHIYHDANAKFPPSWTEDASGKTLHSWRVALLPYMGQGELYKNIRLDEPWDSDHNRQFHTKCPAVYQCPEMVLNQPEIKRKGLTSYSIVVGEYAWPPGSKKFSMINISDGTSNTIAVVERQTPVCWMDPNHEVTLEEAEKGIGRSQSGIAAPHPFENRRTTHVSLFDGSGHTYADNLSLDSLMHLLRRNDGESFTETYDE